MQHLSSRSLAVATLLAPLGTPAWPSPEPPQSCPVTFSRRLLSEKTSHSTRVLSKLAGVLATGSCGALPGLAPPACPAPNAITICPEARLWSCRILSPIIQWPVGHTATP